MADAAATSGAGPKRDRSPSFPFIPLQTAIERLAKLEERFGRHPTPVGKVGLAWGMKEKSSQADQTLAALRSFGLVEYKGSGPTREAIITDDGRNYLRAQQASVKEAILKTAALRPKIIRRFWAEWGPDRPDNAVALDTLILKNGFSDNGAGWFLKVYDATVAFAKLSTSDKVNPTEADDELEADDPNVGRDPPPPPPPPLGGSKAKLMAGERELTTGLLSKEANFRLLVSGPVGVKEIERLIAKLELDKEILAEPDKSDSGEAG